MTTPHRYRNCRRPSLAARAKPGRGLERTRIHGNAEVTLHPTKGWRRRRLWTVPSQQMSLWRGLGND